MSEQCMDALPQSPIQTHMKPCISMSHLQVSDRSLAVSSMIIPQYYAEDLVHTTIHYSDRR